MNCSDGTGYAVADVSCAIELAVAQVVLFDGVAARYAAQLGKYGQAGRSYMAFAYFLLVRDQAEFFKLGVPGVPERHQIGAGLFEGGKILLQVGLRRRRSAAR